MNILLISDYFPPHRLGGVGEVVKNLRVAYQEFGHLTWVLTTGKKDSEDVPHRIIRPIRNLLPGIILNNYHALRLIHTHKIDLVHLHSASTTAFIPFLYILGARRPIILNTLHTSYKSEFAQIRKVRIYGYTLRPTTREYLEKFIFAPIHLVLDFLGYLLSDKVTVLSSQNRKEFEQWPWRFRRRSIDVVPNGFTDLNLSEIPCLNSPLDRFCANKKVIGYIGVLRHRKRVANLLFAYKEILKQVNDVAILIVGDGRGYEDMLRDLSRRLGIQEHVYFTGRVPHQTVAYYLSLCDIFCLPSSYEGMPMAILEAMASKKVVVTTKVSGMIDLIDHNESGLLVPLDDVETLAQTIISLLHDNKAMLRIAENAQLRVKQSFSWQQVAERYLQIASEA